jgi:hypothetical protein
LRQYISQMRQELATRLLNRIYADGDAPSKVTSFSMPPESTNTEPVLLVVVEFHKEKVHGQGPLSRQPSKKAPSSSLQCPQHSPILNNQWSLRDSQVTRARYSNTLRALLSMTLHTTRVWHLTLLLIGERNDQELYAAMFTIRLLPHKY